MNPTSEISALAPSESSTDPTLQKKEENEENSEDILELKIPGACARILKNLSLFLIFPKIAILLFVYFTVYSIFQFWSLFGWYTVGFAGFAMLICLLIVVHEIISRETVFASKIGIYFWFFAQFLAFLAIFGLASVFYLNTFTEFFAINFKQNFLRGMEENEPIEIHQFQQMFECCGVPLHGHLKWNKTTVSLKNPFSSWFYYTILDETYIDEANVLFTLPWSCCRDTLNCEHAVFERITNKMNSDREIDDSSIANELHIVDTALGTRVLNDALKGIFSSSCDDQAWNELHRIGAQLSVALMANCLLVVVSTLCSFAARQLIVG
ncbi:unnamed protein product [Caenorhabditis bovis]|uniref:Tetraspanin n=1 Tax=Caenorhabditis bovis TaxID=2654633 RepID=A0A8S1ERW9_9PELO|nr:unnamed protein product [Caenorhabditis bovis]